MTRQEMEQAAIDYLGRAFKGEAGVSVNVVVVQAAASIVLQSRDEPTRRFDEKAA